MYLFLEYGVFLVEGTSEVIFYKALAKENKIDLDRLNISILSVEGIGFKPYIKVCKALNIPWVLRTDNDVFKNTQNESYYAGIDRAIGIIKDCNLSYDVPSVYQNECKKWSGDSVPSDIKDSNDKMRESLKNAGIYMSKMDLENDLAKSNLNDTLNDYYDIQESDVAKLVSEMQKRKAENMFKFIQKEHSNLVKLQNDELIEPIFDIVNKVKNQVQPNGK